MTEGVDYAFPPIPSAAALKAAGKAFACRYGGPGSAGKQLTADELASLTAAGIAVVANAEGAADGLKGGYDAGKAWALQADTYFRRLGMPADRPIYLSVDFDASSIHWPALDAAMDGAASVIGRERVGVYGSYRVVEHFAANRKARWYWQTYAWSGGQWSAWAHVRQYHNGVTVGGASVDLNRAMVADYGQWTGDDMAFDSNDLHTLLTTPVFPYDKPTQSLGSTWLAAQQDARTARDTAAAALAAVQDLAAQPAATATVTVDAATLKTALLDPDVLKAVAKAVNDDAAARLQS